MATPTITVTTPHGTFKRSTWHDYQVIVVYRWRDGVTLGSTWHGSLALARKAAANGISQVLGFYAVADGRQLAPGFAPGAPAPRGRRAAPKPEPVYEYERCAECDRRHGPERLRCGNCWRCHEPTTKCGTTRKRIAESIEAHNAHPDFYKVLTNTWRPWNEAQVPQCDCHRSI